MLVTVTAFALVALADPPARKEPLSSPPPRATGGIGKAILADNPVDVLGGRLKVRMPQGAQVEARPVPIMGAAESEEHETRVVFDAGQERLALMVHECFAFASDDLEKDVKEWVTKWTGKYRIEPLLLPVKGLKAVALIPVNDPDHSRSDDATFVEGIFVESADRTIQSLDVYVNAAGEKDLKGWKPVAHQIHLSVAPGKKVLRLEAGERRLFANSADLEISVMVPKDTAVTTQVGPDFLVHRLIALGRLGADSGNIVVYAGGAPDYEPGAKKGEGMTFGKKVEWHALQEGQGLQTLCELPIPGDHHLFAHVIIRAPNEAQLKAMREAAESMKLVKMKGSSPNSNPRDPPMTTPRPKVLLSWSSGKDSAWALHVLRQQPDIEIVGLVTTFNEAFDRVAMHAVRRELVEAQAAAAGLPMVPVMLPYPCTNEVYEDRMKAALAEAKAAGVTHMAFGDLFLVDVREYRIRLLEGTGVEPLFPIWTTAEDTPSLARRMLAAGLGAVLTCMDPKQLSERFVGRQYDEDFLAELPAGVDPCGERGEFHTFCCRCPEFSTEIPVTVGEVVEREGFWFADLCPSDGL